MRLSWFTGSRLLRRRAGRLGRRSAAAKLRVRQLERRRVLDAAAATVVVSAVTSTESTTPPPVVTTTTDLPTQQPLTFNWTPVPGTEPQTATSSEMAQGAAVNTPPFLISQLDQSTNEGQLLDLSGLGGAPPLALYIESDLGDTHTATVNWGDGSLTESVTVFEGVGSGALGATHIYADQGTYTVTIVVTDNNGGADSDTFDVLVSPVAPTATLGNSGPVVEGSSATVSFMNQFDPSSADTTAGFHYAYDLDNNGTFDVGDGTYAGSGTSTSQNISGSLLAEGPGDYTVKARIIDKDGQFTDYSTTIHVNNAAPTLTNITGDTINENGVATIGATIVDPGTSDVFSVQVDWLDGSTATISGLGAANASGMVGDTTYQWDGSTRNLQLSHQYLDDGPTMAAVDTYNVSLTVSDDDLGSSGPYVAPVIVNNVPPFLISQPNQDVNEGQLLDLSGLSGAPPLALFVDPGTLDTHTATVNWGDGSATENAAVFAGVGSGAIGGTHVYADDGLYKVTITVTDKDGQSDTESFMVQVNTVVPTLVVPGPQMVEEGSPLTITNIGTITDPGFDNPDNPNEPPSGSVETFTYWISWGDGNIETGTATIDDVGAPFDLTDASFDGSHTYANDGPYTITIRIADDNMTGNFVGGVNSVDYVEQTIAVTVTNDTPELVNVTGSTIQENGIATVSATIVDAGAQDVFSVDVNWQDGTSDTITGLGNSNVSSSVGGTTYVWTAATRQLQLSHQYLDDGASPGNSTTQDDYGVTLLVHDESSTGAQQIATVTVQNVTPSVALDSVSTINENGTATLTGSYTDIGRLDAHTVTLDWDDPNNSANSTFAISAVRDAGGVPTLAVGNTFNSSTDGAVLTITAINATTGQVSFSVQHQYLDDGLAPGNGTTSDVSSIGVTVADDDTQSGTNTTSVTVNNVAPTLVLNAVLSINENGTATLTGSYTDIGKLDGHTLTIDWGDPNDADDATFAIPSIQNAAGVATLSVGDAFNSSTDGAILTITAINTATGQVSFSVQHQYLDDGLAPGNGTTSDISTIGVTVADDDSQSVNGTTTVTVNNVTPSVVLNAVPDINENGVATLSGSYTDIGKLDAHTLTVDWNDSNNGAASTFAIPAIQNAAGVATLSIGDTFNSSTDGAVLTITAIDATTGQVNFSVQHQYLDDGLALGNNTTSDISTIGVTVADDDAQNGSNTATVTVHNVAPSVTLGSVSDINENGVATLTGSYTDIGRLDAHTMKVNWADANDGDASTFAIPAIQNAAGVATLAVGDTFASSTDGSVLTITAVNNATGQVSFSVQHRYLDDGLAPGNGTTSDVSIIGVTVADDDAQNGSNTTTVTVYNVAPVFQNVVGDSINEGSVATVSMNFSDPGQLDVFTVVVDWRDGSTATIGGLGSVNSSGIVGNTTYEWTAATWVLTVSHLYADNASYQVVVRVADDDMAANFAGVAGDGNFVQTTTSVNVANVAPTLAGTGSLTVNEGSALTLNGLGVHLEDVGFDNPANQTPPPFGDQFQETFTSYTIDWGDGTSDTPVNIVMRVSGSPGVPTTALFDHAAHTYADDGMYTVRVRVADDNMSGNFTTGTNGVDYVDLEFTITVTNVAPTLAAPAPSAANINENGSVNFTVSFTDPGFDNPANDNTPANGGELAETFTYDIDWGDGRHTVSNVAVGATPGGVGVPSAGSFGENHIYADDGIYTVIVNIHDDDGGVATQTFVVSVHNTNPVIVTPLNGDDVTAQGITRIRFSFSDLGFDNPANQTPPPNGDQFAETFTYIINWGDGTVDTITISQVAPGSPLVVNSQTMIISSARTSGSEGVSTTGSFEVEHKYNGPPDPLHPAADIQITVTLLDDNGGSVSDAIAIGNPGIDVVNVAIDTTPDVPRLEYVPQPIVQVFLNQQTTTPQSLQTPNIRVARSELALTSDRYLELDVISPEGKVVAQYRLKDEALNDLRGLIATLPDGHYKIYLVRTENNSRRLVLDVNVRQGRVVDPSDDSEGTRDRPPIEGGEQNQAQPLETNPQLQRKEEQNPSAALDDLGVPVDQVSTLDNVTPAVAVEGPSSTRLRWAAPLAGLGLVAQRGSWSREIDAAFDKADEQAWQRLRRAGRRRLVK